MSRLHIVRNATIVNEGRTFTGSVLILGEHIKAVYEGSQQIELSEPYTETDATGLFLLPGVIDDQVHFRDPGLTVKGDLYTESKAAVAGGVTSYMDMPNTRPQATSIEILEEKYSLAATKSLANYSFLMGVTNDNIDELKKADPHTIAGVKMFMGSSTGNMLVDNQETLNRVFSEISMLIVTH